MSDLQFGFPWAFLSDAYHRIDAGSQKVLIYEKGDLRHRVLVFGEADSIPMGEDNPASSALRSLLQDHHLNYSVLEAPPAVDDRIQPAAPFLRAGDRRRWLPL